MTFKTPLAELMRPQNLSEMVGQHELLDVNMPLRQIIDRHVNISLLLWGPPGTGKTNLAKKLPNKMIIPLLLLMLQLITNCNLVNLLMHINIKPLSC